MDPQSQLWLPRPRPGPSLTPWCGNCPMSFPGLLAGWNPWPRSPKPIWANKNCYLDLNQRNLSQIHFYATLDKNHYFNPFDTKAMAQTAVKMSIMRVVKFISSPGNDFYQLTKMSPTLLWRPVSGPSSEPILVSLLATRWLLGTLKSRKFGVKIQNILMFEGLVIFFVS